MIIVGIDEVGRGCLAGPLVAGAVILSQPIKGLKDSKLLLKKEREKLADVIRQDALAVGLGWVYPRELDEVGLTQAVRLAMRRALDQINTPYESIIIDGNFNFLADLSNCQVVIKADASVPAVSAASIMAKVARDNYMAEISADYPNYGFEKHVGYGTRMHLEMLKLHGASDLHRRSFRPVREI